MIEVLSFFSSHLSALLVVAAVILILFVSLLVATICKERDIRKNVFLLCLECGAKLSQIIALMFSVIFVSYTIDINKYNDTKANLKELKSAVEEQKEKFSVLESENKEAQADIDGIRKDKEGLLCILEDLQRKVEDQVVIIESNKAEMVAQDITIKSQKAQMQRLAVENQSNNKALQEEKKFKALMEVIANAAARMSLVLSFQIDDFLDVNIEKLRGAEYPKNKERNLKQIFIDAVEAWRTKQSPDDKNSNSVYQKMIDSIKNTDDFDLTLTVERLERSVLYCIGGKHCRELANEDNSKIAKNYMQTMYRTVEVTAGRFISKVFLDYVAIIRKNLFR